MATLKSENSFWTSWLCSLVRVSARSCLTSAALSAGASLPCSGSCALSSVDTYTEEKILPQLRGVMRGRTSLIVSHRISTVRDADLICVLDEGRINEQGTHNELLALGGEYSVLYERQLLEEELALT